MRIRSCIRICVVVAWTVLFVSCSAEKKPEATPPVVARNLEHFNLVYINIDALRADHLGCYGYRRDTSPFIDSLAKEGVVFDNALSNSSFTQESVSVLLSGLLPSSAGSVGWLAEPTTTIANLGELFSKAGYRTGLFSNTIALDTPRFLRGFDESAILSNKWDTSRTGHELSKRALEFVQKNSKKPFAMVLHYLDPHAPYDPPPQMLSRFVREVPAPEKPLDLYADVRPYCTELIEDRFGLGESRFEDIVLRYDAEIADTDSSIRQLVEGLKKQGVLDHTLIVISADHGEEFLEHGFVDHGWTLYRESIHIPLILWAGKSIIPARISERVSTVDYLPSFLAILGIVPDRSDFDGSRLFEMADGGWRFRSPERPTICELLLSNRCLVRAVITDRWKYCAAQRWLIPSERQEALALLDRPGGDTGESIDIWGPVTNEQLYDVTRDVAEQHDMIDRNRSEADNLKKYLEDYKIYCMKKGRLKNGQAQSMETSKMDSEKIEILRNLGYIGGGTKKSSPK
jgi:arylsulfatase A-like enzyme